MKYALQTGTGHFIGETIHEKLMNLKLHNSWKFRFVAYSWKSRNHESQYSRKPRFKEFLKVKIHDIFMKVQIFDIFMKVQIHEMFAKHSSWNTAEYCITVICNSVPLWLNTHACCPAVLPLTTLFHIYIITYVAKNGNYGIKWLKIINTNKQTEQTFTALKVHELSPLKFMNHSSTVHDPFNITVRGLC